MRLFYAFFLSILVLSTFGACHATNSVELFRVNENGEVVNIGRASDDEHIIYGHFRSNETYDRAFLTVQNPTDDANSVCYTKIDDGQVNGGVGVGIRMSPCSKAKIVNEGPILEGRDGIGIFDLSQGPWATYVLYIYDGTEFTPLLQRPIFDDHLASGIDAFRVNPANSEEAFITYSKQDADGVIGIVQETLPMADILQKKCVTIPNVKEPIIDSLEIESDASQSSNELQNKEENTESPAHSE